MFVLCIPYLPALSFHVSRVVPRVHIKFCWNALSLCLCAAAAAVLDEYLALVPEKRRRSTKRPADDAAPDAARGKLASAEAIDRLVAAGGCATGARPRGSKPIASARVCRVSGGCIGGSSGLLTQCPFHHAGHTHCIGCQPRVCQLSYMTALLFLCLVGGGEVGELLLAGGLRNWERPNAPPQSSQCHALGVGVRGAWRGGRKRDGRCRSLVRCRRRRHAEYRSHTQLAGVL